MRSIFIFLLLLIFNISSGQDLAFSLDDAYVNPFGNNSDLVGFTPIFKLESKTIYSKNQEYTISRLPQDIDMENAAYAFLLFNGLEDQVQGTEVALLIDNYSSEYPTIYVDRNGNFDFTDDEDGMRMEQSFVLGLNNVGDSSATYHYRIGRSQIAETNADRMRRRYASRHPNGQLLSPTLWLTNQRLTVRISFHQIDGRPFTVLLQDNSIDGLFTFQPHETGDRICIIEGHVNAEDDLNGFLRRGEPIDHNAVFELYGQRIYVKEVARNGNRIELSNTHKEAAEVYLKNQDVSAYSIDLLDRGPQTIGALLAPQKHLLLDIGGTWCGGCISQQPTIQKLYQEGKIDVVGVFGHDTEETVRIYAQKHKLEWPLALLSPNFKDKFRINQYPTYILLSPEGKIVLIEFLSEKIVEYFEKL